MLTKEDLFKYLQTPAGLKLSMHLPNLIDMMYENFEAELIKKNVLIEDKENMINSLMDQMNNSKNVRVFKVITRDKKSGRQVKKHEYSSHESYLKYGIAFGKRFSNPDYFGNDKYTVEHYELINNIWIMILKEPQEG